MLDVRRREFIPLLGGAAAAWPLAARAQEPKMPVVGNLNVGPPVEHLTAIFRQGLAESGYVEGRKGAMEFRHPDNQYDRLPELAAELVRRRVGVIVAINTPPALAANAATT